MQRVLVFSFTAPVLVSLLTASGPVWAQQRAPRKGVDGQVQRVAEPDFALRVAVIGDFGVAGPDLAAVAALVQGRAPELVLTVGDNNYPAGAAATIDDNIGQYYSDWIAPYLGIYGPGSVENRFFPALGNRDWVDPGAQGYLGYFVLPGNERYYDFVRGKVHFFVLDSDVNEPDGIDASSVQAQWLQAGLAASGAPYRIVLLHHAPYSSSTSNGPNLLLQWPFAEWGAHAVVAGHDHLYERLEVEGIPYFVDGLGGHPTRSTFETLPVAGSAARYRADHGALFVDFDNERARFRFLSDEEIVFDEYTLFAEDASVPLETMIPGGATWKYYDLGGSPGAGWAASGFDDSGWAVGEAHFGYGDGDEATVIGFGPDRQNKFVTSYFRHDFTVFDPANVSRLRMDVLRDDGFVAYLNGTEVRRANMPTGPVDAQTLASQSIEGNPEDSFYEYAVDPTLLATGTNTLALEIHQASPSSDDVSFDLKLLGYRMTQVLVPRGADWRFLDDGSDPGAGWPQPGFDDSAWTVGPAELGYGEADEATVVSFGPDPLDKHVTTYFRHPFQIVDASAFNALTLGLLRDDGAVVYLNGTEVYRYNLPIQGVTTDTTAAIEVAGAAEAAYFPTRIDHTLLIDGTNWLAVELHQASPTSDDLSFDLDLVGQN